MSVKIMRSEGFNIKLLYNWACVLHISKLCFFLSWFRSHVSSAMQRCANGHPRTLPLLPLPQLPPALHRVSHCASCVLIRLKSRAPAVVLEKSKRKAMTGRGAGNSRRAGRHVNVTLKATIAAMAPEAPGASSFGTRGARLRPDATLPREVTGILAKSRISHQFRQSKNLIWIEKICMNIHGYI